MAKSMHFHSSHTPRRVQCSHRAVLFFFLLLFTVCTNTYHYLLVHCALCTSAIILMWILLILEASGSWSTITSCTVGISKAPYIIGREQWEHRNRFNARGLGKRKVVRKIRAIRTGRRYKWCKWVLRNARQKIASLNELSNETLQRWPIVINVEKNCNDIYLLILLSGRR